MDACKKELLDKIWLNTKIFEYYQLCADCKFNEADMVRYYAYAPEEKKIKSWKSKEIIGSELFTKKEREIASKIKKHILTDDEREEYLMSFGEDFYNAAFSFLEDYSKPSMNNHTKEKIDEVWRNTIVRDIIISYFKKDKIRINEIYKEINAEWFARGGVPYYVLYECKDILKRVKDWNEWEAYLFAVNYENTAMWDAFYDTKIFAGIEQELLNRTVV